MNIKNRIGNTVMLKDFPSKDYIENNFQKSGEIKPRNYMGFKMNMIMVGSGSNRGNINSETVIYSIRRNNVGNIIVYPEETPLKKSGWMYFLDARLLIRDAYDYRDFIVTEVVENDIKDAYLMILEDLEKRY